jgi:hypothetical protein
MDPEEPGFVLVTWWKKQGHIPKFLVYQVYLRQMDTVQQNVTLFQTVMTYEQECLCTCLYESQQNDYHYLTKTIFHKMITVMVYIDYFLFMHSVSDYTPLFCNLQDRKFVFTWIFFWRPSFRARAFSCADDSGSCTAICRMRFPLCRNALAHSGHSWVFSLGGGGT